MLFDSGASNLTNINPATITDVSHFSTFFLTYTALIAQKPAQNIQLEKQFCFHPLHIKGLIVSCWRPLNGQNFKPGCQVRMWILNTKIQDEVQNGRQKDEFSNFPHIVVKDLHKYTHFYVVLLRSNLQSIIRL